MSKRNLKFVLTLLLSTTSYPAVGQSNRYVILGGNASIAEQTLSSLGGKKLKDFQHLGGFAAEVPPGQAKFVTCMAGAVVDFVVDIRVGSPTFGRWDAVLLSAREPMSVYISEGLGHGFLALEEGSTVAYLLSSPYSPGAEHGIDPLDPQVGLDLRGLDVILSTKDREAPSLADAATAGLLPTWAG